MTFKDIVKRRESFLPAFLVVLFICVLILLLSISNNLKFLSSFLEKGTSGVQAITFDIIHALPFSNDSKIKDLENRNLELLSKVSDFEKLQRENQALSDQFQTSNPKSLSLLKADIIGAPGFIPGVTTPTSFILNKGVLDGVKIGQAVIAKDNLIGIIKESSDNLSKVILISNSETSFTGRTETGALGVVKGEGNSLVLDNIELIYNIKDKEIVFTNGDIDSNGVGIPQNLVVGKISSLEKNPSDLFQKAKIESFVNFNNLSTVFIYLD